MTKNRPQVIKRIVPEKRSPKKKKVSSNTKRPVFWGVFLTESPGFINRFINRLGKKTQLKTRLLLFGVTLLVRDWPALCTGLEKMFFVLFVFFSTNVFFIFSHKVFLCLFS